MTARPPGFDLSLEYVGSNGNVYSYSSLVAPDSDQYWDEVYDGGTVTYNEAIAIPADQVESGMFTVSALWDFYGEETWVAAS